MSLILKKPRKWRSRISDKFQLLVGSLWSGYYLDDKLPRYITNTKVNSAFHPSGVGKSSTGLSG